MQLNPGRQEARGRSLDCIRVSSHHGGRDKRIRAARIAIEPQSARLHIGAEPRSPPRRLVP